MKRIDRLFRGAAVLAVVLSSGCAATSSRSGTAEESWVQTADGVLLHCRKVGEGPEVLLVPGASWVADDMRPLAPGRTVIFYDPRGRGRSEARVTTDIERDIQDLEEVRAWFGLERFALLGNDYSAALAAHYAVRHPEQVERLVLVSPVPLRKFPHWKIYNRVYRDRQDETAFSELQEMKRTGDHRKDPDAWAEAYREALMTTWVREARSVRSMKSRPFVKPNHDPELQIVRYFDKLRAWGEWDWREVMGGLDCPTLGVFGDSDPMPAQANEEWGRVIPASRVEVIEKSGRLPWIEQPRTFFNAVNAFLQ
jgi:proline iminopeptidase